MAHGQFVDCERRRESCHVNMKSCPVELKPVGLHMDPAVAIYILTRRSVHTWRTRNRKIREVRYCSLLFVSTHELCAVPRLNLIQTGMIPTSAGRMSCTKFRVIVSEGYPVGERMIGTWPGSSRN